MSDAAGNKATGQKRGARRGLRALGTAIILLLLGAVVNVLVAWWCVLMAPPVFNSSGPWNQSWFDPLIDQPGWSVTDSTVSVRAGVTQAFVLYDRTWLAADGLRMQQSRFGLIWCAGWPYPALACAAFDATAVVGGFRLSKQPGAPAAWPAGARIAFPYLPRWPGFAANTALYTAVLTVGFVGFRWSWRRFRHHPGTCGTCGYDLSGNTSGVCPECGGRA